MSAPAHNTPIAGTTAEGIAASIEQAVRSGALVAGDQLPTVRALAEDLDVSPGTVASAYSRLRRRGVVVGERRRGTIVADHLPAARRAAPPVPRNLVDLASGSPDPRLLPDLGPFLARIDGAPGPYPRGDDHPALITVATRELERDGVRLGAPPAVVHGALDGVERVLMAWLRPGDAVAVEDPGFANVLDLVAALGLRAAPVAVDGFGLRPDDLRTVLATGVRAVVLTPRAQNPTGAALDARRAQELAAVLDGHPDVLVVEDDHAGPVAGVPVCSTVTDRRTRWAVVRSVSKWLGPDLRLAVVAADPTTLGRVRDRQSLGPGWVSHLMQQLVAEVWTDPGVVRTVHRAARAYGIRRDALLDALARRGVAAEGRSGLNVWVPVASEHTAVAALAAAGFAVSAGERFRIRTGPAVRISVSALDPARAPAIAAVLAEVPTRRSA